MWVCKRLLAGVIGVLVGAGLAGCGALSLSNFLNPNFIASLGPTGTVSSIPGQAPGLLVRLENRVPDRWVSMQISYLDDQGQSQTDATQIAPNDASARMLVCPIAQITLGDMSNLQASGVSVFLGNDPNTAPIIEVEAFGTLLRSGVNYNCGDEIIFTVQPSSATQSGYQTIAYFRRAGT